MHSQTALRPRRRSRPNHAFFYSKISHSYLLVHSNWVETRKRCTATASLRDAGHTGSSAACLFRIPAQHKQRAPGRVSALQGHVRHYIYCMLDTCSSHFSALRSRRQTKPSAAYEAPIRSKFACETSRPSKMGGASPMAQGFPAVQSPNRLNEHGRARFIARPLYCEGLQGAGKKEGIASKTSGGSRPLWIPSEVQCPRLPSRLTSMPCRTCRSVRRARGAKGGSKFGQPAPCTDKSTTA
jgi:hypothetical protein